MPIDLKENVNLRPYSTLRAGGQAQRLGVARSIDDLAEFSSRSHQSGPSLTVLGWGSNVLPSDSGVAGTVIVNAADEIVVKEDGSVVADAGCGFQTLFLQTAQRGLEGLEYAVGIPGTLGGALVSNAGAYRSCISESIVAIEVVDAGVRKWVEPSFMRFAYRDSILRSESPPSVVLLRVKLSLQPGNPKAIYDRAREFQRQRIGKQPAPASAGSFFKNVVDAGLASSLDSLPIELKKAGVVPSGYLVEACGLKGARLGGAQVGLRHANFLLNVAGATASDIRSLAHHVRRVVFDRFGVELEEEVLYLGVWDDFVPTEL